MSLLTPYPTLVAWIRRYIFFHGKRHPADMGAPELTRFLTALAVDGKVAASTQNQALSALLFLYREVLARDVPVAERDWEPPPPRFGHEQIVGLRVAFAEVAVRDRVKQAGGTWNPERRVWQLLYDRVVALGLNSRIVDEPASNSGCPGSSGENLHADAGAPSK